MLHHVHIAVGDTEARHTSKVSRVAFVFFPCGSPDAWNYTHLVRDTAPTNPGTMGLEWGFSFVPRD